MYNGYSPYLLEGWLLVGQHRTFLPFPSYVVRFLPYSQGSTRFMGTFLRTFAEHRAKLPSQ